MEGNNTFLTVIAPAKATNTWTDLEKIKINAGYSLCKRVQGKLVGVLESERAAPISGLVNAFWQMVSN